MSHHHAVAATKTLTLVLAGVPALAQTPRPVAKPMTIVVPFPPGGGTDTIARMLAPRLQEGR